MEAVVFDFDGVLADSMPQHAAAYRRILAPLGITFEDHDIFLLEGARSQSIIRDLLERAERTWNQAALDRLADLKQQVFRSLGNPTLYPGAGDLIEACADRVPVALVTGTRRENLDRLMPRHVRRFQAIMAQADYTHDKPHPEPYAKAAQALGVDPAACIAVENAVRGVASAKAAGYGEVVAITTTLRKRDLKQADKVVKDHAALRKYLLSRVGGPKDP